MRCWRRAPRYSWSSRTVSTRISTGSMTQAWHLMGWHRDDTLAAYLRVLPPGSKFPEHCIGRVLVSAAFRGHSLGRELMLRGLARIEESFGPVPLRLSRAKLPGVLLRIARLCVVFGQVSRGRYRARGHAARSRPSIAMIADAKRRSAQGHTPPRRTGSAGSQRRPRASCSPRSRALRNSRGSMISS